MSVIIVNKSSYIYPTAKELSTIRTCVTCDECYQVFYNDSRLHMHQVKVHEKKNLTKNTRKTLYYKCPINNCIYANEGTKFFNSYKYLKQHFLKVHAEKKFTCDLCTKKFSTESSKQYHQRICGVEFKCHCLRTFSSYESLLTHVRRKGHIIPKDYNIKKIESLATKNQSTSTNKTTAEFLKLSSFQSKKPILILPKFTCDGTTQTESIKINHNPCREPPTQSFKSQICRQTQTTNTLSNNAKKSAETQTSKAISIDLEHFEIVKDLDNQSCKQKSIQTINLSGGLNSLNIVPNTQRNAVSDFALQTFWEEKNTGTQTSPEKNLFDELHSETTPYSKIIKSDPMLNEKTFNDKFSSIETQTEKAYCKSLFDSDSLIEFINNETQTTENNATNEQHHFYSNMYTQTYMSVFPPDLVLSDIQTQTAWCDFDETTACAETQTKTLKCQSNCSYTNSDWFTIQTNHMQTQTDLLNIFEDLD